MAETEAPGGTGAAGDEVGGDEVGGGEVGGGEVGGDEEAGGEAAVGNEPTRRRMQDRLTFLTYRTAALIARRAPRFVPVVEMGGLLTAALMPERRAVVARNQQRIARSGPSGASLSSIALRRATLKSFISYARYWGDSFRVNDLAPGERSAAMRFEGLENLQVAMKAGHGVIMGLPHIGSWDFGGAALAALGYPMTVVVESSWDEALFDWFVERRRAMGLTVIPLGPGSASQLLHTLRSGGLVGLVCDRDLPGGGVPVSFFGEQTTLPAGPATLAVRTGAALLPTAVLDGPGDLHCGVILPPLDTARQGRLSEDVARITRDLAVQLEALIRRAPEQWHLFQPNWPSDPGYGESVGDTGAQAPNAEADC